MKTNQSDKNRIRSGMIGILLTAVLLCSACASPAQNAAENTASVQTIQENAAENMAVEQTIQESTAENMAVEQTIQESTAENTAAEQTIWESTAPEPAGLQHENAESETSDALEQSVTDTPEGTEMTGNDIYGAALTDAAYNENGGNIIMSPLSVNMALAMALEGAQGRTKEEIEQYLGVKKDDLDDYITVLMEEAASSDETEVLIANAFWYLTGTDVNGEYLEILRERYTAETGELDFTDAEAAAKRINSWCSGHTNGLIPQIVSPDAVSDLSDLILNTVYFNCAWTDPIDGDDISTEPFYGFEKTKDADLLYSLEGVYFENEKATAFLKPYVGRYSFVGILPKEEGDFNLADLDLESLLESRTYEYDVHAVMPKLNVESGGSIADILKSMGIRTAFTGEADFSGISDQLYISDVVHKTKLILDEKGTEAAAATAVEFIAMAAMPEETKDKTVRLDRPYAFLILDDYTGAVLFIGKITEP